MQVIWKILQFIFWAAVVIFVGIKIFIDKTVEQEKQERVVAQSKVSPSEITISNLQFTPTWGMDSRMNFDVTGRITNNSRQYTVSQVAINLSAEDCKTNPCAVVGTPYIYAGVTVPPGQARDFRTETSVGINGDATKVLWKYGIRTITAY